MKINPYLTAALLLAFGGFVLVSTSYASEDSDPGIQQVVSQRNPETQLTLLERSKIENILRLPAPADESRTEKRSVPFAELKDTLCGLKGVTVFIEDVDTDVENHGVTKSLLKKEVESRLRQADIPVLTTNEAFNMPGKPYLYLNLTTHSTGIELYSYSIRIELNQDVSMIRDPSIKASATTWIANVVGVVGERNLPAVTEDVTQLTDKFIHDYLAANQK